MAEDDGDWVDVPAADPQTTGGVNAQATQEEDWIDVPAPKQAQGQGAVASGADDGDWVDVSDTQSAVHPLGSSEGQPSNTTAFIEEGLRAAPTGLVSGAGALSGAGVGAALTLGNPLGALAGAVIGGVGYGILANYTQDQILAAAGWNKGTGFWSEARHQANQQTTGGKIGEIVGGAAAGFGVGGGANLVARGIGAGAQAGLEGARQIYEGEFDPTRLAASAGAGAVFFNPRSATQGLANAITPKRYRGGNVGHAPTENAHPESVTPDNPEGKPLEEVPLGPGETPDYTAFEDQPAAATTDTTSTGKANDQDIGALGAGPVNQKVTVRDVGNENHAAGDQHEASGPNAPARNYPKDTALGAGEQGQGVVHTSETGVAPDVAQALEKPSSGEPEPVQRPVTAEVPAPEAAPTTQQGAGVQNPRPEPFANPPPPEPRTLHETAPPPEPRPTGLSRAEIDAQLNAYVAARKELAADPRLRPLLGEIDRLKLGPRETIEGLDRAKKYFAEQEKENAAKAKAEAATPRENKETKAGVRDLAGKKRAETGTQKLLQAHAAATHDDIWKGVDLLNDAKGTKAAAKKAVEAVRAVYGGKNPFQVGAGEYVPRGQKGKTENLPPGVLAAKKHLQELFRYAGQPKAKIGRLEYARIHMSPEAAKEIAAARAEEANTDMSKRSLEANVADTHAAVNPEGMISKEPLPRVKTNDPENDALVNDFRDWFDDLSVKDFDNLKEHYGENFWPAVMDTKNVAKTKAEMVQALEALDRRIKPRVYNREFTMTHDFKPKKENLPTVGRKIDPNSEEGRLIAQQALAGQGKALSKGEQIKLVNEKLKAAKGKDRFKSEEELAKDAARKKAERDDERKVALEKQADLMLARNAEKAVDGTSEKGMMTQLKGFLKDERASGKMPEMFVQYIKRFRNPTNPASPNVAPGVVQAEEALMAGALKKDFKEYFQGLRRRAVERDINMQAAVANAKAAKLERPYDQRKLSLAEQKRTIKSLPKETQDYYWRYAADLRANYLDKYREFRDLAKEMELPGREDLPDPDVRTDTAYQHRLPVGKEPFDAKPKRKFDPDDVRSDPNDPFGGHIPQGRDLTAFAATAVDRRFDTFVNLSNRDHRVVFERLKNPDGTPKKGEVKLWLGQNPTATVKVPASFRGHPGDTVIINYKGKPTKFEVDNGRTDEIETATRNQVQYHNNVVYQSTHADHDMDQALNQLKLYKKIITDPQFTKLIKTREEAKDLPGYSLTPTRMPKFAEYNGKDAYLPDAVREVLDDIYRPGFGVTSEGLEAFRRFNTTMTKVFNTSSPLVHVWNELNRYAISRGSLWLDPRAYPKMVPNLLQVVHDVNNPTANGENNLMRRMERAGVEPRLPSVWINTMYERAARDFALEMKRNWKFWDLPFKPWNYTAAEFGNMLHQYSSDVTWRGSDYLTGMRFLEEVQRGLSDHEAADQVNKFYSYEVGQRLLGQRWLQQAATDPLTTQFGRYKARIWSSITAITSDLVKGDPILRQKARTEGFGDAMVELKARQEAAAQIAIITLIATAIEPAVNSAWQTITGEEGAEQRSRGINAPVNAILHRKEKGVSGVLAHTWTPSMAIQAVPDLYHNKDFRGQEIIPTAGTIPQQVAGGAEYVARMGAPPYGQFSQMASRRGGSLGTAVKGVLMDQLGAGIKSDAGMKYENTIDRRRQQEKKKLDRGESGVIPSVVNWITGQ